MKYLKNYQKFFEDEGGGVAMANASIGGLGPVVAAEVGPLPGVPGEPGSGDIGFGLGAEIKNNSKRKRKKGTPKEVSDLRDFSKEFQWS